MKATMFTAIITDLKTPYIVYLKNVLFSARQKRLNVVNFKLCFIETTVATTVFFSSGLADWLKNSFDSS